MNASHIVLSAPRHAVRGILRFWYWGCSLGWLIAGSAFAGGGGGFFPPAGVDSFASKGIFKVTLSPTFGGTTHVIKVNDPAVVTRSDPFTSGEPCSGPLGDPGALCPNGCSCTPDPDGTCDSEIGPRPSGFDASGNVEEAHIELKCLTAQDGGWTLRFGEAAPQAPRSLGEVEARQAPPPPIGFPADSFFNLHMQIDPPPGFPFSGQVLRNISLLQTADLDGYSFGLDGGNVLRFSVLSVAPQFRQSAIVYTPNTPGPDVEVGIIEATCGSGVCEPFEDFDSCPLDCTAVSVPAASTGSLSVMAICMVVAATVVLGSARLRGFVVSQQ